MGSSERSSLPRRIAALLSRGGLVALFVLFAWANFSHWRATGKPSGLGTTALEGWAAVLFLVRRPAGRLSHSPVAWVAAPVGSFAMLLARPADGGLPQLACELLQLGGVLFALAGLATLGRSFGLVAADRGLKTGGPYRFVRHPAYTGYLVAYIGYVLENPAPFNVLLLCISTAFQLLRIREEEAVLAADDGYRRYQQAVPYRLVPRLF
jgi:protein-S-isoprenylcysteine O-methyltransferase Ste14